MKKLIVVLVGILIFSSFAFTEDEDDLYSKQQEKINVDGGLNTINSNKNSEINKQRTLKDEIEFLAAAEGRESEEYQSALKEYEGIVEGIDNINQSIIESENEYQKNLENLSKRMRALYASSDDFVLGSIIKSKNIMEFFEKVEYMSILAENDRRLLKKVEMSKIDLDYKLGLEIEQKEDMAESIQEMEDRIKNLESTKEDIGVKIELSKEQVRLLNKREDELLALSRELVDEIRELQRNIKYAGGTMLWPVPSNTTLGNRLYGIQFHPILRVNKMHTGIDIGAKTGASIIAANSGTVIFSGWKGGYGYAIMIDHGGGIVTLYAHCSKLLVIKGQGIEKGQTIAKVGSTGQSTGPHLHFEVRENGETVDPLFHVDPNK